MPAESLGTCIVGSLQTVIDLLKHERDELARRCGDLSYAIDLLEDEPRGDD